MQAITPFKAPVVDELQVRVVVDSHYSNVGCRFSFGVWGAPGSGRSALFR